MTYDDRTTFGLAAETAGTAVHSQLESMGMGQSQGDSARPGACGSAATAGGGDVLSEYSRRSIYADAERASKLGQTILDACAFPWFTAEGKLWRQVFRKSEAAKSDMHAKAEKTYTSPATCTENGGK